MGVILFKLQAFHGEINVGTHRVSFSLFSSAGPNPSSISMYNLRPSNPESPCAKNPCKNGGECMIVVEPRGGGIGGGGGRHEEGVRDGGGFRGVDMTDRSRFDERRARSMMMRGRG